MRDFIIAILALIILCFGFSSIETHAEIIPTGNWYVSADSGTAISWDGEEDGGDAFSFSVDTEKAEQLKVHEEDPRQTKGYTEITEESEEEARKVWEMESFILGVAAGALLAELATASVIAILYLREKEHGHQTGKA